MDNSKLIDVEVQYFKSCPNYKKALVLVKQFCSETNYAINVIETIVDTTSLAIKHNFRGSPTILINGHDLLNMDEPSNPTLTCRYYPDGFPTIKDLEKVIKELEF